MATKPKFIAYAIVPSSGSSGEARNHWTRIGAAFENRDQSVTVLLNALPVNARIVLRVPDEDTGRFAEPTPASDDFLDV